VIRRFYVHNYRCLENFELPISGQSSILLIGKNGSGKSTIASALEVLQKIARGTNRVSDLVSPDDFPRWYALPPMRFEIEIEVSGKICRYVVAFESTNDLTELSVSEEEFTVDGTSVYFRASQQTRGQRAMPYQQDSVAFRWNLVALPIVQEKSGKDPLLVFKQWLARMLILRPMPALIDGQSKHESLEPNVQVTNFGAWFSGIVAANPAAYRKIDEYLRPVIPDFKDIQNPLIAKDVRSLVVGFSNSQGSMSVYFEDLSDGEKCFMISALVLAANEAYGPLLCFWDEPDNYLALDEVGHFVIALRQAFEKSGGQFIATSHNPEVIRRFSDETTLLLYRKNHLEPTVVRRLGELHIAGDLVGALTRGIEP